MKTYAERKWDKCNDAVAYALCFTGMCYGNGYYEDYYKSICDKCDLNMVQVEDYIFPKSSIPKNKAHFLLDIAYDKAVKPELMEYMLEYGISKDNFRPIYTRNHQEIIAYQITPTKKLGSIASENGYKVIKKCTHCGAKKYELDDELYSLNVYDGMGYPLYINETELAKLEDIAICSELNDIIISLDFYTYLLKEYPKIECRPVFLGDVYHDNEYIKMYDTNEKPTDNMVEVTMLEYYTRRGERLKLGCFKSEQISEKIKTYMGYEGFNDKNGVFLANKSCYIDKNQKKVFTLCIWNDGNYPQFDDELDEYNFDSAAPNHIEIVRNAGIAKKHLNEYKDNICSKVLYDINEFMVVGTEYWEGGFTTYFDND